MFVKRDQLHQIADIVTAFLADEGYRCIDAEFEAHTRTLRLYIDHDNGIDLDACTKVSTRLIECAEIDEIIPGEFNLEVSSPGIERPIRTLRDFEAVKTEGCQINVTLTEKYKNRRRGVGRVSNIDQSEMISMSTTEGAWTFPWNMVLKATKVVDWTKVHQ